MIKQWTRMARVAAAMLLVGVLAACGGSDSGGGGSSKDISIGVIEGWTDETSNAYLMKYILEQNGYRVTVKKYADNAPFYDAISNGDVDVHPSAWIEKLHKTYWGEYGEDLEDIGAWYEGAKSFIAVPKYSKFTSIDELPGAAEQLEGQVTGIEAGAGLMETTKNSVFPAYQLSDSLELSSSSTAAMLADLGSAINNREEIAVTMWTPFWANIKYPIKPLADPKGAFGKPEDLHILGSEGFREDHPEVATMLENYKMDDQTFGTLEDLVVNKYDQKNYEQAVKDWVKDNPEFVKKMGAYLKG